MPSRIPILIVDIMRFLQASKNTATLPPGRREADAHPNVVLGNMLSRSVVVIPVLNPGERATELANSLLAQRDINRVIILDSESTDGSRQIFETAGFRVIDVSRKRFDHGATRNLALTLSPEADFVVYLTQDVVLRPDALKHLVAPFADPSVGLVCGRQLPRPEAGAIERHARMFNYPARSVKRSMESVSGQGIKAVFNSNSFAAYRREALVKIGGFPNRVIFGEDQLAAGLMLVDGWSVCYEGRAEVIHSHGYTMAGEFRRYFDHGVVHAQYRWLLQRFGTASGAGLHFVLSELKHLVREEPGSVPEACLRTLLKFAGYQFGLHEARLPNWLKLKLSMNRAFFSSTPKYHRTSGSR